MKKFYSMIAVNFKKIVFFIIILILILSFAMWGISDVFRNLSSSSGDAVEIDGNKISDIEVDANYRQYLQMIGNGISVEDGMKYGLLEQSVKKITMEIALNKEAQKLGIEIGEDLVAKTLRDEKAFQNEEGEFDSELFLRAIQYSGYRNEKQFVEAIKKERARLSLLNVIKSGAQEINLRKDLLAEYDREVRSAKYILLPFEKDKVNFTDEDLKNYYKENIENYKTPELKDLSLLIISKDAFKNEGLSDEELEDEVLSKVNVVDDLLVEDVSLEEIAAELGLKITSLKNVDILNFQGTENIDGIREILGTVNDMRVSSPDSKVSELKEMSNGSFYIVRVDATSGYENIPFAKVKSSIIEEYVEKTAEKSRREEGVELVKEINDGSKTIDEIAKQYGFKEGVFQDLYRRPDKNLNNESGELATPIILAQLFSKEKVEEAGIAVKDDGVIVFVLSSIDYKKSEDKEESVSKKHDKRNREYLIVETFADSLLDKYNAKIDYDHINKIYNFSDNANQ